MADGLLTASTARPRLAAIADMLGQLEARRSPALIPTEDLVDPAAAWVTWTITQRREVVRILFGHLSIRHVGNHNGPRANPSRGVARWNGQLDAGAAENVTS